MRWRDSEHGVRWFQIGRSGRCGSKGLAAAKPAEAKDKQPIGDIGQSASASADAVRPDFTDPAPPRCSLRLECAEPTIKPRLISYLLRNQRN